MVEDQASHLGTGDRIAITVGLLAAAVAIAAVAFEHAYPDASTATWRIIFCVAVIVAVGALTFLIFDLVIRPRLRRSWAIATIGIIVFCILAASGGYVASNWPTSFLKSELPSSENPPAPTGPIISRLDHFILNCDVPPPAPGKTVLDTLWELQDYKQKLDILGDAIGVDFTMVTIRGGIRLEAEAVTEMAKQRMPMSKIGVTKFIFEIRRIDKYELVSVFVNLPPQFGFFGLIPPNPAAPDLIQVVQTVERFFGFRSGVCRIV